MRGRVFCAIGAVAVLLPLVWSCRTAGFQRAYAALDSEGNRKRDTFFTDTQSIYCVGELVSGRADVTVTATIKSTQLFDASGQLVPYEQVYTVGELAPGKTQLTLAAFAMQKTLASAGPPAVSPDALPFPAGRFVCELSIDGSLEETVPFSIDYPACPAVPVAPAVPCKDWVKPGSVCPGGTPGQSCTCAASGSWECM